MDGWGEPQFQHEGLTGAALLHKLGLRRVQALKDSATSASLQAADEAMPQPTEFQEGDELTLTEPLTWKAGHKVKRETLLKTSGRFQKTNPYLLNINEKQNVMKSHFCSGVEKFHLRDMKKFSLHVGPKFPKLQADTHSVVQKIKSTKTSLEDCGIKWLCHAADDPALLQYNSLHRDAVAELDTYMAMLDCSCDAPSNKGKSVMDWDADNVVGFKRIAARYSDVKEIRETVGYISVRVLVLVARRLIL